MRHITISHEDNRNLNRVKQNHGEITTAKQAQSAWHRFKDTNGELFYQALQNQYGLCCYSEFNLSDLSRDHNIGSHFEHVLPKASYPHLALEAQNILRSAISSEDLQAFAKPSNQVFGGHHKDNQKHLPFDENLFISPLNPECVKYFTYLPDDGFVMANSTLNDTEREKAQYTIDILNLNAPFLKAERKRRLQEIKPIIDELVETESLEGLQNLAECELTLTERQHPQLNKPAFDQLNSFFSAHLALFGKLGDKVINQHCPQVLR